MTPFDFLFALLVHEAPVIGTRPALRAAWEQEVTEAVLLDSRITKDSIPLVSPEVDAALLDSMRWYEARLQSHPKDGDCRPVADKLTHKVKTVCSAFGPLQVQRSAFQALQGEESFRVTFQMLPDTLKAQHSALQSPRPPLHVPRPTGHVVEAALRVPETGVRAGYAALARWKALCGGTPARWLTAWGWGKCPPARVVDREAVRRCELTVLLLTSREALPEGWRCGHEGRKIRDERDARFFRWAWQMVKGAGI